MKVNNPIVEAFSENPLAHFANDAANHFRSLPIYKVAFPVREHVAQQAHDWARKLFLHCRGDDPRPEPVAHDNRLVLVHPDGYRVRGFYASNWLEYRDQRGAYRGVMEAPELRQADELVRKFVQHLDLWSTDTWSSLAARNLRLLQGAGASNANEFAKQKVINAIVSYQRTTNEIPWIGPGSAVTAMLASSGVVGLSRPWREIAKGTAATATLISFAEALDAHFAQIAKLHGKAIPASMFKLERVEFGYYTADRHQLQRFLQPAYQVFYRTQGQAAAGVVETLPAHRLDLEPLGPVAAPAKLPIKRRPELSRDCKPC